MRASTKIAALAGSLVLGAISAAFANDDQVLAEYSGQYTCLQGTTALQLRVFGNFSQPTHRAVFQFGPTLSNPTIPSGSFVLEGTFQTDGGIVDLHPFQWISQPYGYTMVGLTGRSGDGGNTFIGSVVNGIGCSSFAVRRTFMAATTPPVPAQPLLPNPDRQLPQRQGNRPNGYGRSEISLRQQGGTLVVPALLNNALTLDFVIDSGAADVSVPVDVAMTLYRTGTVHDSDFLGSKTYQLADGSTVPSTTFRIRSLKVGNREVQNVVARISNINGSLLLGQSFLNRFKSWSIDNNRQTLVLE